MRISHIHAASICATLTLASTACGDPAGSSTGSTGSTSSTGDTGTGDTGTTGTSAADSTSGTVLPTGDASETGEPVAPLGSTAVVALLETTDIHTNLLGYDYFKLTADPQLGLERTATLVQQARLEFANTLLVDNGDTIQGTVLADHQALVDRVACDETLAVYKAMNHMAFDVGGIGNHEFNYGLEFLSQVTHTPFDVTDLDLAGSADCQGPEFPLISSNVYSMKTDATLFPASVIVERTITATTPDQQTVDAALKVGFFDFTPPAILKWDKRWLDGKVYTKGVQEIAEPIIADLRARGADLVVAIIHGGLSDEAYTPELVDQAWYLAQVPGVDAMLMGHSHQAFPNPASTAPDFNLPLVDKAAGTVAGVPAVMAGSWGQHLGVIKLELKYGADGWSVDPAGTVVETRPISSTCLGGLPAACDADERWRTGEPCAFAGMCTMQEDKVKVQVAADPSFADLLAAEHEATIAYVKTPIGTTDFELSSAFADVGDVGTIQIVNQAQADHVATYIKDNLPQYAALPLLSVSAPFKTGFQGGKDYTLVPAGKLAINNAADLYLYANTLHAVKVTGAELRDWLETAATRFNTIDPALATPQPLINLGMPGYNFDMLTDPRITYAIDVTKPLPPEGEKASGRIVDLKFEGAPIDPAAEFIVATNNYRASGGGSFPGLDGTKTIYASPDTNRDVLIQYIKKIGKITRVANGSARSWSFVKVDTAGLVTFSSAQDALPLAEAAGLTNISLIEQDDGSGKQSSLYAIDLGKP